MEGMNNEQQITTLQSQIDELQKQIYQIECSARMCCVCGKQATQKHMSTMGWIPFYVCEEHYTKTFSAMGGGRMGLMAENSNGQPSWIDLPYLNANHALPPTP